MLITTVLTDGGDARCYIQRGMTPLPTYTQSTNQAMHNLGLCSGYYPDYVTVNNARTEHDTESHEMDCQVVLLVVTVGWKALLH